MATDGIRKRQVHSTPLSPPKQESPPSLSYRRFSNALLFLLFVYRFINVLLVQTRFVPDEYFQSIEVSYYMNYQYPFILAIMVRNMYLYIILSKQLFVCFP